MLTLGVVGRVVIVLPGQVQVTCTRQLKVRTNSLNERNIGHFTRRKVKTNKERKFLHTGDTKSLDRCREYPNLLQIPSKVDLKMPILDRFTLKLHNFTQVLFVMLVCLYRN